MPEGTLNEKQIRAKLKDYYDNSIQCGLEAFVVKKDSPKLKRMSLSEDTNGQGKNFRTILKEMFFNILGEQYLSQEAEYADGRQLADNQHKYLIFEQGENFQPFTYFDDESEIGEFILEDLTDASGLAFRLRKGENTIWLYQHLWSIMVPNKKKTNIMARLMQFENQVVFSEQNESLLTIAKKVDVLIMDNCLITSNIILLQKYFGFQDYIYQSAQQAVQSIVQKNLVVNTEKLTEYISRGKSKYAKKMMRIGSSKVLNLTQEQLIDKINSLARWRGKFNVNQDTNQITLNTYGEVESLIDLFDERYTRSDVTNTEYDTNVKTVAQP
ncbi:MAG: DUF4868 domain-containing protein [Clostridia bacterium]|jgi:hypothetical protein|nr:DUF4868 domain-containing protein [Clostridia bacterium]MCI1999023.1 DUF4868 domain-containing protein [Clostridia bacterium]MCI2013773.1 DUF4868 domain-containing protein [Clostridia bacterium]